MIDLFYTSLLVAARWTSMFACVATCVRVRMSDFARLAQTQCISYDTLSHEVSLSILVQIRRPKGSSDLLWAIGRSKPRCIPHISRHDNATAVGESTQSVSFRGLLGTYGRITLVFFVVLRYRICLPGVSSGFIRLRFERKPFVYHFREVNV